MKGYTRPIEIKEGLPLLSLFLPSIPHLEDMCVCENKRGKKAAKNTMETERAEIVVGSDLIASLLTNTDKLRDMFYIEHWLKVSLLTA